MRRQALWCTLAFIGALQAHYLAELWYAGTLVLIVGSLVGEWSRAELQYGEQAEEADAGDRGYGQQK